MKYEKIWTDQIFSMTNIMLQLLYEMELHFGRNLKEALVANLEAICENI